MASDAALALLRANVGYPDAASVPAALADVLANDLDAAVLRLKRSGITVDPDTEDPDDRNLLVMYAAWLFNKRKTGEGMPLMLSREIHNRQTALATGGGGSA